MVQMLKLTLLTGLIALASACSSPTVKDEASAEFAQEGLHEVKSSGFAEAYVLPSAELESYDAVTIEPLELASLAVSNTAVQGTVRRNWDIGPEQKDSLQQAWQDSAERAFRSYTLDGSGASTLRITSALTRIQPGRGSLGTSTAVAGTQPVAGPSGEIVDISAEFRIFDQGSGDLLAVIRDTRRISAQQWTRTSSSDMAALFNSWAGLLHTRVSGK